MRVIFQTVARKSFAISEHSLNASVFSTFFYRCRSVALEPVRYKRNSLNASSLNANLTVSRIRVKITTKNSFLLCRYHRPKVDYELPIFDDRKCFEMQMEDRESDAFQNCCYKGIYLTDMCSRENCIRAGEQAYKMCCLQKFVQVNNCTFRSNEMSKRHEFRRAIGVAITRS